LWNAFVMLATWNALVRNFFISFPTLPHLPQFSHRDPCSYLYYFWQITKIHFPIPTFFRLFNCFSLFISSNEAVTLGRPLTKVRIYLPSSIGPVCVMVMHNWVHYIHGCVWPLHLHLPMCK
jgi:hypothetical protein